MYRVSLQPLSPAKADSPTLTTIQRHQQVLEWVMIKTRMAIHKALRDDAANRVECGLCGKVSNRARIWIRIQDEAVNMHCVCGAATDSGAHYEQRRYLHASERKLLSLYMGQTYPVDKEGLQEFCNQLGWDVPTPANAPATQVSWPEPSSSHVDSSASTIEAPTKKGQKKAFKRAKRAKKQSQGTGSTPSSATGLTFDNQPLRREWSTKLKARARELEAQGDRLLRRSREVTGEEQSRLAKEAQRLHEEGRHFRTCAATVHGDID